MEKLTINRTMIELPVTDICNVVRQINKHRKFEDSKAEFKSKMSSYIKKYYRKRKV